eukprot:Colp12_sorted_trinity150504_noHs@7486
MFASNVWSQNTADAWCAPTFSGCRIATLTQPAVFAKKELDKADTIRLTCYDVLHQQCLHKYADSFPSHTAPAGYVCPACQHPIIPPENLKSPVAEELRRFLCNTPWAAPRHIALPTSNHSEVTVEMPPPELHIARPQSIDGSMSRKFIDVRSPGSGRLMQGFSDEKYRKYQRGFVGGLKNLLSFLAGGSEMSMQRALLLLLCAVLFVVLIYTLIARLFDTPAPADQPAPLENPVFQQDFAE